MRTEPSSPVPLPAYFGAKAKSDVFVQPYTNGGRPVRTQVLLTHHLLSLVQEGEKEVIAASERVRIDASQLLLLSATSTIMSEHNLQGRPMRSMLLFFSNDLLLELCTRRGIAPDARVMELIPLPQDVFTRHFVRSIELLDPSALNRDPVLARIKAEEVLLYLAGRHPQAFQRFLAAAWKDRRDLSLRQVVAQHQDSNLTLPELAFLCHMSVSTFKRRFQEVFGAAPGRFMQERRMQRAKALLARRMRPSEIYADLGYGSLAAFSTEFKKYFGVAPGSLR